MNWHSLRLLNCFVVQPAPPPDYDDIVSRSSGKPEKYPVIQLDINGQTYPLEAMIPDYSPDDWIIPDKLMDLITE